MFKRLLTDAVSLVFGNLEMVFKVCGTWFAIQVLLSLVIVGSIGGTGLEGGGTGTPADAPPAGTLLLLLVNFSVAIVAATSIAVAWHRFALLGEQAPAFFVRFGALEMRFLWAMTLLILIGLAAVVPVLLLLTLLGFFLPDTVTVLLILPVILFLVLPHLMRLNLVLPAAAVERPLGFFEAHRLGEGLGWRMLWAVVVLSLPFTLAGLAIEYILSLAAPGLPLLLIQVKVMILNVLLQILVTVLGLSVITAAYRIATEREREGQI